MCLEIVSGSLLPMACPDCARKLLESCLLECQKAETLLASLGNTLSVILASKLIAPLF